MDERMAREWVEGFAERWAPLQPDRLADLMHADTQNLIPPMTSPADRDGVVAHFRRVKAMLPDLTLRVERWAWSGDAVFVEWLGRATVRGAPVEWRGVDRVRLRAGKTFAGEAFWDTRRLAELMAAP